MGEPLYRHLAITHATFVSGTFQQVTNLLNIMESDSTQTDAVGAGFDMRKRLASVIITEKATTQPSVVMNALIRCLQVPEVGPPPSRRFSELGHLLAPPSTARHTFTECCEGRARCGGP